MAKVIGFVKIPILARLSDRDYEIGSVELEVTADESGEVNAPTSEEFIEALHNAGAN